MRKFRIRRGLFLAGAAASLLLLGTQVSLPAGAATAATTAQQDDPSLAACADFQQSGWHYGDATSGADAAQFSIHLSGKVGKGCSGDTYVLYLFDQTTQCVGGAGSVPGLGCTGQLETTSTQIAKTVYTAKSVWGQSTLNYSYNWCSSGCSFAGPPPGSAGDTSDTLCVATETVDSTGAELDGAPTAAGSDWSPSNSSGCLVVPYGSGGGGNQFY